MPTGCGRRRPPRRRPQPPRPRSGRPAWPDRPAGRRSAPSARRRRRPRPAPSPARSPRLRSETADPGPAGPPPRPRRRAAFPRARGRRPSLRAARPHRDPARVDHVPIPVGEQHPEPVAVLGIGKGAGAGAAIPRERDRAVSDQRPVGPRPGSGSGSARRSPPSRPGRSRGRRSGCALRGPCPRPLGWISFVNRVTWSARSGERAWRTAAATTTEAHQERHEQNGARAAHGLARSAPAITTTSASPAARSVCRLIGCSGFTPRSCATFLAARC